MAREYQTWNRGNNLYDDFLAQIMFGKEYPRGTSERKEVNGEWVDVPIDPIHQGPNARRVGKMEASAKEDEALRGKLRGKRELREGEKMPRGAYSLAQHPGLWFAVQNAKAGRPPAGGLGVGWDIMRHKDPERYRKEMERFREWGNAQASIFDRPGRWGGY